MRVTIKGLRRWIAATAGLLLVVVAGFFFYGRYRFRRIEKDLPGRLGINIQQTASGFTFSQASGGHTVFSLKAARQIQLKSGHVLLHDVDITMYGPPGSGRADRIYGSDFEYNQNTQVATSQGEVNIELSGINGSSPAGATGSNTIRVRTQGLSFAQKTGQADTSQAVEFQLPRAAGTSVGAHYNSKTGLLVLDSQVAITSSSNGKSAVIHAAHATLLRANMQADLTDDSFQYEAEDGSSDQATVYFRKDGTTEKIDASGHVRMKTDSGATVQAATAVILMDAKSQPSQAEMGGGVQYASAGSNETMRGSAAEGTLLFAAMAGADGKTQTVLRHAEFRRDVDFAEAIAGLAKDPRGRAEKHLQAQKLDMDFALAPATRGTEVRKAIAEGNPVVTMQQMPSKGPAQTTRISGDRLVTLLGDGNVLQQLDGAGHTRIVDESTDGSRDTSQGDLLHATFVQQAPARRAAPAGKPPAIAANRSTLAPAERTTAGRTVASRIGAAAQTGAKAQAAPKDETTLEAATQDGNVVLTEKPAKEPGAATEPATLTGWSQHAEYHASDEVLHLSGSPRISDGQTIQMSADRIDYHRDTQDASGSGNVKATYRQSPQNATNHQHAAPAVSFGGGNQPVHVIAERAELHHATNQSDFYGTVRDPARLWQDPNSLTAPMIEIDRNKNVLRAWGEGTGAEPVVETNFTSAMGPQHQQSLARVHSQRLVYSDKDRVADFRGAVTLEQVVDTIRADDALVFLKPAATRAKTPAGNGAKGPPGGASQTAASSVPSSLSGNAQGNSQIDHVIASGHVVITQPGRRGEGTKLVYTADNGRYVLTGTAEAPPHLWDSVHGTTTGAALLFNSQDDSVEVSGGKSSAVTDTRAPK